MDLSKQETEDLIEALNDALDELARGFPEADAIGERWEALIEKLKANT